MTAFPRRPVSGPLGFTLIEMAIVLMIVGLLAGGALYGLNARDESNRLRETQNTLGTVTEGLTWFALNTSRLPCPDTTGDGREDQTGTACSATVGAVPYGDLDLTRAVTRDGWGNDLRYVVDPRLADAGTLRLVCPDDLTDADSYGQVDLSGLATNAPESPGYLLISHGANGTDDASAQAQANATNGAFSDTFYETSAQTGFDELVRYRTPAKILIDTGCQLAASDPTAVGGTTPPPPEEPTDCTTSVFGTGLNASGQGGIVLDKEVRLQDLPTTELQSVTVTGQGTDSACDGAACTASGSGAGTLDIPDAPANSSTTDYTIGAEDSATIATSANYDNFTMDKGASLTLDGSSVPMTLNLKGDFSAAKETRIRIRGAVTLYAKDFSLDKETTLTIDTGGSLTLIVSGDLNVAKETDLNRSGTSDQLLIMVKGNASFDKQTNARGYIYADGDIDVQKEGNFKGSLSGRSISIDKEVRFQYDDSAPSGVKGNCP